MKKGMLMTSMIALNIICLTLFLTSAINNTATVAEATTPTTEEGIYKINGAEPFIGEIAMFAGNFAPRGWAFCDGQTLDISSNTALFSLLGTTYGGDGRRSFKLPDLRGRAVLHEGQGPGLPNRMLGSTGNLAGDGSNAAPYATVNYIIALQGVYPSRN